MRQWPHCFCGSTFWLARGEDGDVIVTPNTVTFRCSGCGEQVWVGRVALDALPSWNTTDRRSLLTELMHAQLGPKFMASKLMGEGLAGDLALVSR